MLHHLHLVFGQSLVVVTRRSAASSVCAQYRYRAYERIGTDKPIYYKVPSNRRTVWESFSFSHSFAARFSIPAVQTSHTIFRKKFLRSQTRYYCICRGKRSTSRCLYANTSYCVCVAERARVYVCIYGYRHSISQNHPGIKVERHNTYI